jgi:hypothetical protein
MNFSSIYKAVVDQYNQIRAARGGARKAEDKELGGVKSFRFQVRDEDGKVLNTFSRFGNGGLVTYFSHECKGLSKATIVLQDVLEAKAEDGSVLVKVLNEYPYEYSRTESKRQPKVRAKAEDLEVPAILALAASEVKVTASKATVKGTPEPVDEPVEKKKEKKVKISKKKEKVEKEA